MVMSDAVLVFAVVEPEVIVVEGELLEVVLELGGVGGGGGGGGSRGSRARGAWLLSGDWGVLSNLEARRPFWY